MRLLTREIKSKPPCNEATGTDPGIIAPVPAPDMDPPTFTVPLFTLAKPLLALLLAVAHFAQIPTPLPVPCAKFLDFSANDDA